MKIVHIVPSFYPAHIYGGPIESTYQLCRHLALNGCHVRVLTTDANGPNEVLNVEKDREVKISDGVYVRYCKRAVPHTISLTFLSLLPSYISWADVVHLAAVYSFPTIPTLLGSKILNKPVIWSPQGSFKRWEGSTRVQMKALWNQICQFVAPSKLILHVTSEEEAKESSEIFTKLKTFVIPNGVTIPDRVKHHKSDGVFRLLYLGRLHPIKGIENLLEACKIFYCKSELVWPLNIAGAGDPKYTDGLRIKVRDFGLSQTVKMVGEVRGDVKQNLFENADVVVVPSYTENFGMVVAEALAHGVPVIASKGTPWKRLEEIGCGVWVNNDPRSLAGAIEQMSNMPLRDMGQSGREWMAKEFSWVIRAKEMLACYDAVVSSKSYG